MDGIAPQCELENYRKDKVMKTVTIKKREILERTKYRNYRFKFNMVSQFYCTYGDEIFLDELPCEMAKIRVPLQTVLCTRSYRKLDEFVTGLGRSDADKRLKRAIKEIREKYLF